jgi:hypothetical protein
MFRNGFGVVVAALTLGATVRAAHAACPKAVTATAEKAYASAKIEACKEEKEHDKVQYEVKLTTAAGERVELDIAADGTLLQTETAVELSVVPRPVLDAFHAKYPKATAKRAEKQVKGDGAVFYELAWQAGGKRHEATFGADGTFVAEE